VKGGSSSSLYVGVCVCGRKEDSRGHNLWPSKCGIAWQSVYSVACAEKGWIKREGPRRSCHGARGGENSGGKRLEGRVKPCLQ
jgi:hypothetical protein